jgi:hypothetical protein
MICESVEKIHVGVGAAAAAVAAALRRVSVRIKPKSHHANVAALFPYEIVYTSKSWPLP